MADSMHNTHSDGRVNKDLLHDFPIELLQEIFWLVCSTFGDTSDPRTNFISQIASLRDVSRPVSRQYHRTLANLPSVCKSWHEIIHTTPRLWAIITSFDPPPVIDRAFQQSGQNALIVKGKFKWDDPDRDESSFLAKVCTHVERWEEVDFELVELPDARFFQSPAPRLRHFRIGVKAWPWWNLPPRNEPVHLFGGDAPMLKTLDITRLAVHWGTFEFSGLQSLTLRAVDISLNNLLRIINNISTLWELELHDLHFFDSDSTGRTARLSLPYLTRCGIAGLSTTSAMAVLGNLIAPICEVLSFKQKGEAAFGRWDDTLIAAWLMNNLLKSFPVLFESPVACLSARSYAESLYVSGGNSGLQDPVSGLKDEERLQFHFAESPMPLEILAWLAERLEHPLITIDIQDSVYLGVGRTLLHKIPSTTHLGLSGTGQDLTPVLEDLGTPLAPGDESQFQWLLPNLLYLSFSNRPCCTRNDVLKMVQQRYAHTDGVPPPARLGCLTIRDIPPGPEDATTIESLEQLLGKDVVDWKEREWGMFGGTL